MTGDAEEVDLPSDLDAEGEEDVDMEFNARQDANAMEANEDLDADGEADPDELSEDPDAEGEDDEDAEGEEDEDTNEPEYHGAVKIRNESLISDAEEEDASDGQADGQSGSDNSDESSSESEANEWEAESVNAEGEADIAGRNNCVFCHQDEEHDPGEDYEEYLACAVCGDNAHGQCARDNKSLLDDNDAANWRCPGCIQNDLEADGAGDEEEEEEEEEEGEEEEQGEGNATKRAESIQRRLSTSSHRLTKDLLPAARGEVKPGSHSIFNTLIPEDDPADGSRSLRKRKASSDALEPVSRASSKRPKNSDENREPTASPVTTASRARSGTAVSRNRRASAVNVAEPSTPADPEASTAKANTRTQRSRRSKKEETGPVHVLSKAANSLILAFKVDMTKIRPPKRKRVRNERDRERDRNRNRNRTAAAQAQRRARQEAEEQAKMEASGARPRFAAHAVTPYNPPFYAFHEREEDEKNKKPYGGILSEIEAANEKTFPDASDRAKFDKARRQAEEEWKERTAASEAEQEVKSRAAQKVAGPPSKIKCISFGGWEIDTWYAAPYPEEYSRNRVLYICEFCLKYMGSDYVAWRHKLKCPMKHPPGDEIYRDGSVSVFEVDGRKNPAYCQNLCLLAKLFLGSKTLYYDVEPFLFYIMTEYDELGCHFVGYFSKEKRPSSLNNVSCILTLPIHQRKGYGNLLIDFSYLLTKVEKKTGSPEKPLSDMGLVTYRKYWGLVLCYLLRDHAGPLSISDISDLTGMTADDIVAALEALRALVRDPVTKTYALRLDKAYFQETIEKWESKGYVRLNPDALMWTPYVMGRSNLANYDRPALATIAPREGEEDDTVEPEEGVQQQQQDEAVDRQPNGVSNGVDQDIEATPAMAAITLPDPLTANEGESSPAKPPALILTNGLASKAPASSADPSPIPPTRYELYPPVAGTIYRAKRGGYRPKGSRMTAMGPVFGDTPAIAPARERNRNRSTAKKTGKSGKTMGAKASPSLRKTRSQIGTPVVDSRESNSFRAEDGDEDVDADADADADGDAGEPDAEVDDASMQDAEGEDEEYVEGEEDAEGEDEDVEEEEEED